MGIKTYLFENFSQKKGSRKFYVTFLGYKSVKNGQLSTSKAREKHPGDEVGQLYLFLGVRKS